MTKSKTEPPHIGDGTPWAQQVCGNFLVRFLRRQSELREASQSLFQVVTALQYVTVVSFLRTTFFLTRIATLEIPPEGNDTRQDTTRGLSEESRHAQPTSPRTTETNRNCPKIESTTSFIKIRPAFFFFSGQGRPTGYRAALRRYIDKTFDKSVRRPKMVTGSGVRWRSQADFRAESTCLRGAPFSGQGRSPGYIRELLFAARRPTK